MKTLGNYIFWAYPRGSFHYDIMVTLILAIVFVSPHYIDFKDKPAPDVVLNPQQVLVKPIGNDRFVYQVRTEALHGATTDADIRAQLYTVIAPIAGAIKVDKYTPILDTHEKLVAYDVTVSR